MWPEFQAQHKTPPWQQLGRARAWPWQQLATWQRKPRSQGYHRNPKRGAALVGGEKLRWHDGGTALPMGPTTKARTPNLSNDSSRAATMLGLLLGLTAVDDGGAAQWPRLGDAKQPHQVCRLSLAVAASWCTPAPRTTWESVVGVSGDGNDGSSRQRRRYKGLGSTNTRGRERERKKERERRNPLCQPWGIIGGEWRTGGDRETVAEDREN